MATFDGEGDASPTRISSSRGELEEQYKLLEEREAALSSIQEPGKDTEKVTLTSTGAQEPAKDVEKDDKPKSRKKPDKEADVKAQIQKLSDRLDAESSKNIASIVKCVMSELKGDRTISEQFKKPTPEKPKSNAINVGDEMRKIGFRQWDIKMWPTRANRGASR